MHGRGCLWGISTGESGSSQSLGHGVPSLLRQGPTGPCLLAWSWAEAGAGSSSSSPQETLGWELNSRGRKALGADYPRGLRGEGTVGAPGMGPVPPRPYQSLDALPLDTVNRLAMTQALPAGHVALKGQPLF